MIQMLNVPTHLGPSLVPAMRGTVEMDGLAQVSVISYSVSNLNAVHFVCKHLYEAHSENVQTFSTA